MKTIDCSWKCISVILLFLIIKLSPQVAMFLDVSMWYARQFKWQTFYNVLCSLVFPRIRLSLVENLLVQGLFPVILQWIVSPLSQSLHSLHLQRGWWNCKYMDFTPGRISGVIFKGNCITWQKGAFKAMNCTYFWRSRLEGKQ